MRYEATHISLRGDRRRNEDRCCLIEQAGRVLLVVADGMGGHPRGEVASQILVDTCAQLFRQPEGAATSPGQCLLRMLGLAHERIVGYGAGQSPPIAPRTTAVVAMVCDQTAYWAHVGDSRLYLYRGGTPLLRTSDHSYVEQLHQQGLISDQECQSHPYRHYVTRCLGGDPHPLEISLGKPTRLQPGDTLLLCSDGFWGVLTDQAIGLALQSPLSLAEAIGLLAREAERLARPDSDNVTTVALRWLEDAPASLYKAHGAPDRAERDSAAAGTQLLQAIAELSQAIERYDNPDKQESR